MATRTNGPPLDFPIRAQDRTGPAFRSVRQKGERLSKFFATGLLVGAGAGAASLLNPLDAVRDSLEDLDALSKRMRTSGFTAEFFQTVGLAANEASVDQDGFNRSMLRFVGILGEARAGRGELVEALRLSHPELVREIQLAADSESAFRSLADAVREAETADEKARLTKAAFGDEMLGLTRVLNLGSDGLDRTAQKARELGIVIEQDLLDSAEQLQTDFAVASKVIDTSFQKALVNLAPIIVDTVEGIADISGGINTLIDRAKQFFNYLRQENRRVTGNDPLVPLPDRKPLREPTLTPPPPPTPPGFSNREIERASIGIEGLTRQTQELSQVGQSAAGALSDAFLSFGDSGRSAMETIGTAADSLLRDLVRLSLNRAFLSMFGGAGSTGSATPAGIYVPPFQTSTVPAFQSGGSGRVAGAGGVDSRVVSIRATPGEIIDVHKGDPARTGSKVEVHIHNNASNTETTQQETQTANGGTRIDVMIDEIAAGNIRRAGSQSNQAVRSLGGRTPLIRRG